MISFICATGVNDGPQHVHTGPIGLRTFHVMHWLALTLVDNFRAETTEGILQDATPSFMFILMFTGKGSCLFCSQAKALRIV